MFQAQCFIGLFFAGLAPWRRKLPICFRVPFLIAAPLGFEMVNFNGKRKWEKPNLRLLPLTPCSGWEIMVKIS